MQPGDLLWSVITGWVIVEEEVLRAPQVAEGMAFPGLAL